jgi:hypothetical protein
MPSGQQTMVIAVQSSPQSQHKVTTLSVAHRVCEHVMA